MSKKKHFNILMIGPAGSGKGTQGDLIKNEIGMFKLSAGDALREHRQNNGQYASIINKHIDAGELVPVEITNNIVAEKLEAEVYSGDKYKGVIFDGYPRQTQQATFISDFLLKKGEKIDLVVNINVPVDVLIDRLSGRFMCDKCGEIYHKTTKNTKSEGICDVCGETHFSQRADDVNIESIRKRFSIFEDETKKVLDYYVNSGTEILNVDGSKSASEIGQDIKNYLNQKAK